MPTITFRGKSYNSVFEMPDDVRKAYQREKKRPSTANQTSSGMFTDLFDMPDEVREIYQRALKNVEERPASTRGFDSSQPARDRRPSDEHLYRPSPPIIQQTKSAIEPESGTVNFIVSLVAALLLLGIVYLVMQSFQ